MERLAIEIIFYIMIGFIWGRFLRTDSNPERALFRGLTFIGILFPIIGIFVKEGFQLTQFLSDMMAFTIIGGTATLAVKWPNLDEI